MTIYIQNLSREIDEAKLRELFEKFGTVSKINILKEKATGKAVGIAFVEMPEKAEGEAAIAAMHGKEFGGMALNVKEGIAPEDEKKGKERQPGWRQGAGGAGRQGGGGPGPAGYRGEGGPHAGGAVRRSGKRGS
jgi:RNA recognition motif-containing protein